VKNVEQSSGPHWVAEALKTTLAAVETKKTGSKITTLVLLSGGIDSVAVLANLLVRTDHRVHVHHIELDNRDNRVSADNDAVADVVDYCWKNFRDFEYSSSKNEFRVTPVGYDLIVTMFHAAMVCLSLRPKPDYVMTGHFLTSRARAILGTRILNSCFGSAENAPHWLRPLDALPDKKSTKIHIYQSVPRALAELSWSCRTPRITEHGFEPCGHCYACKNLDAARAAVRE